MHYLAAAQTDIGNVKHINQDSLTVKIAQTMIGEVAMAVICDGMGGLEQGEAASASVVNAFQNWFYDELPGLIEQEHFEDKLQKRFMDIIFYENDKIMDYGKKEHILLGTTVTVMLFLKSNYYVIHVGDCRVYELTDRVIQLTKDQTVAAKELALGHITLAQARSDARRNILLQCVGVNKTVEPVFFCGKIAMNASYVLCSDGFRHEVTDEEIFHYCNPVKNGNEKQMEQSLKKLIQLNKSRQEKDNISAILIRSME